MEARNTQKLCNSKFARNPLALLRMYRCGLGVSEGREKGFPLGIQGLGCVPISFSVLHSFISFSFIHSFKWQEWSTMPRKQCLNYFCGFATSLFWISWELKGSGCLKGWSVLVGKKLQKPTQERTGKNRNNTKPRKPTWVSTWQQSERQQRQRVQMGRRANTAEILRIFEVKLLLNSFTH